MTENRFTNLENNADSRSEAGAAEQVHVRSGGAGGMGTALKEELRVISPVLAGLSQSPPALSPAEWAVFDEDLRREINVSRPRPGRALRDRLSASDNKLARMFAALILFDR